MRTSEAITGSPEHQEQPDSTIYKPKEILETLAANHERDITQCDWFRSVTIAFDTPDNMDPEQQYFRNMLTKALVIQGHQVITATKNNLEEVKEAEMVIGFDTIPTGPGSTLDRTEQRTPPNALDVRQRLRINPYKNYALHVLMREPEDDLTRWRKRDMEDTERILSGRLGAPKLINDNPNAYALFTMEGGFGSNLKQDEDHQDPPIAIQKLRDRLVTHACANDVSGGFKKIKDAVSQQSWEEAPSPDYLANAFQTLGKWGYLSEPFDLFKKLDPQTAEEYYKLLSWSRQSESAGAIHSPEITIPEKYRVGEMTGSITATMSGRNDEFNLDKRTMTREQTIQVSIVPNDDLRSVVLNDSAQHTTAEDISNRIRALSDFSLLKRYALGLEDGGVYLPSVEFDEMAAALLGSPLIRVSLSKNGKGYVVDEEGDIFIPRIRGFVHVHQSAEAVHNKEVDGISARDLVEYIPPNFDKYPYAVGCGKDITVGVTTDAVARSEKLSELGSGTQVLFFDALNHGTNFLALAEPILDEESGEYYIPFDPLEQLLKTLDPQTGVVRLTEEVSQP